MPRLTHIAILLSLLAVFSPVLVPPAPAANPSHEHIVISGGCALHQWEKYRFTNDQHDKWWGNFIRTARIRFEQLRQTQGPDARITWLVYRPGYTRRSSEEGQPLLSHIESVRDKFRVKLVWFDSGQDVINYLNKGMNRGIYKIATLDYFGHSNKYAFIFDYSNHILGASKAWLHERDLRLIKRGIFAKGAYVKSYGCHTAESMSKAFHKHTRTKMWGAIGKTDYSYSWQGTLPTISSPGGHWSY